jgi:alkylation response protein AidB-like acyl-CoA dehydrogenase
MELSFSPAEEAFRQEVREFIEEKFSPDMRDALKKSPTNYLDPERQRLWQKALFEKGWAAPKWPVENGGTGWTAAEHYIYETEIAAAGAPRPVGFGARMVGPVIIQFGRPDQKERYLPRILAFDDWWCQGYSEPGSGSDLASLSTRAIRDGDEYIVNGSKIWTTLAQHADWIFCLVRTSNEGKRQEGISFLLIDMKTPGIRVEPIILIDGEKPPLHEVNQVFFDDVRVPVENRIGEENKGWTYAKYLLEFERGGSHGAAIRAGIAKVKHIAAQEKSGGRHLIADPDFRLKVARLEMEVRAVETSELRILGALGAGQRPGAESSVLKLRGTELGQAVSELAMEALGYYAQPHESEYLSPGSNTQPIGPEYGATVTPRYFNYRKASIYGGSNEIQHNIIAKLILGL